MEKYFRGSEWRRWDLHVHTRASYDYAYQSEDAEDLLINALKDNQVVAVAITDHFVIDANKIKSIRVKAPTTTIFPGVELRTDKGGFNVHVILIFSDQICVDTLSEDFDAIMLRSKARNSDDNNKIYWDWSDILEFAKERDGLVSLHAGRKTNGVDDKITNALDISQAIKEEYAQDTDIFEIGKVSDIADYHDKVFPQIGIIKPLVLCSDNHDPRNYNEKTSLWIKADPTFNGLKQILYEPEERVRIQDTLPEPKADYYVIDSVKFNNEHFQEDPIFFNDKLTCIVGGKSTGKSILLNNLASSIDEEQVKIKCEKTNTDTMFIEDIKVTWADGENSERKIVYLPQTYLNRLSDEKEEKTEIDNIIQEIVLQSQSIKKAYNEMETTITEYKPELDKLIYDLLDADRLLSENMKRQNELGNRKGIEAEIDKIKHQKEEFSAKLNLSPDEIKDYDGAINDIEILNKKIQNFRDEIDAIQEIEHLVTAIDMKMEFSTETDALIKSSINKVLKNADVIWLDDKKGIINTISEAKVKAELNLKEKFKIRDLLQPKIQENQALTELNENLMVESLKLDEFIELENLYKNINEKKQSILNEIIMSSDYFKGKHTCFADIVNASTDIRDELEFHVNVPFRKEAFLSMMKTFIDNRSLKNVLEYDEFSDFVYTAEKLREIINKILNEELKIKGSNDKESLLRNLLADWYNIAYEVKMDGDTINIMSPGKKALVLLKLLISLSESNCPILIDQPEDDLDNRSIFNDLIPFIKKKKKERQIIIVTHNANIVLGSDAEEIIIANQDGNDSPKCKRRFEYRSGSIENEDAIYNSEGNIEAGILNTRGIQQHICDILEGGKDAFELRKRKYHI
jgi:ABC-type cobalamin/Fe3+-siderophores transport system ATPase subunit